MELARRHGDFAIAGLAFQLQIEDGIVRDGRLAYFASEDRPTLAGHALAAIKGRRLDHASGETAAAVLERDLKPMGGPQGQRKDAAASAARVDASGAGSGAESLDDPCEGGMSDEERLAITLTVNGERVSRSVPVRQHLVDFLRTDLGLTGSHLGCEHGVCGACSVRVDGAVVRGCLMLAVQADGAQVVTIEGLAESGEIADLQEAFVARNALQCGFCTPGMLMTAAELLAEAAPRTREEIRTFLSGNYCRCTGFHAIVDAVETTLGKRVATGRGEAPSHV